jgi:hypothetical protein
MTTSTQAIRLMSISICALFCAWGCETNEAKKEPPLENPMPLGSESQAFYDLQIMKARQKADSAKLHAEDEIEVFVDMQNARTN